VGDSHAVGQSLQRPAFTRHRGDRVNHIYTTAGLAGRVVVKTKLGSAVMTIDYRHRRHRRCRLQSLIDKASSSAAVSPHRHSVPQSLCPLTLLPFRHMSRGRMQSSVHGNSTQQMLSLNKKNIRVQDCMAKTIRHHH